MKALVFVVASAVFAALFLLLPRELSQVAFSCMVVASLLATGYHQRRQLRTSLKTLVEWRRGAYQTAPLLLKRSRSAIASYRHRLSRPAVYAACALLTLSAYHFRPGSNNELLLAFVLMVVGILLLGIGLNTVSMPLVGQRAYALRPRWLLVVLGAVSLFLLAEISGDYFDTLWLRDASHHAQFALLVGGMALVAFGLGGGSLPPHIKPISGEASHTVEHIFSPLGVQRPEEVPVDGGGVKWATIAILLITLLAFAVRFWELGEAVRAFIHEITFARSVIHFWHSSDVKLLLPMEYTAPLPWLYNYWQSATVEVWGHNLTGLRATSAILGALNVPALYILAKYLFDRKTALVAALLLATFPPHIHFSRIGILEIADAVFGTMSLALLARGLRTQRPLDYALGGVFLGLTHYFHEGGRLLFTPLVVIWLIGRWRSRSVGKGLVVVLLACFLVAFPIYYTLLARGIPLTLRMNDAGLSVPYLQEMLASDTNRQQFLLHLTQPFLFYVHRPDTPIIFMYYGGDHPLVLEVFVPFLLLGVGVALWKLRAPGPLLLILWVLAVSLGNGLLRENVVSTRYRDVFPALALLMAVGLRYVWPLVWRYQRRTLALLVVGGALIQTGYYFGPHLETYYRQLQVQVMGCGDMDDAIIRAAALPPGTHIHVISTARCDVGRMFDWLHFAGQNLTMDVLTPDDVTPAYVHGLSHEQPHAFLVKPADSYALDIVSDFMELSPPRYSTTRVPPAMQFTLYGANWRPDP